MKKLYSLMIVSVLMLAGMVQAALIEYNGGTATARADNGYVIGSLIEIGDNDITINALGVQDVYGGGYYDGFYSDPEVGLWSADGSTLIASATVSSTDYMVNTYRYASVGEITLAANTQYLLGAKVGGGIEFFWDADGVSPIYSGGTGVTMVGDRLLWTGGTLAAPTADGGGDDTRWAPANAAFIPEPATMALLGLGSLFFVRRKK